MHPRIHELYEYLDAQRTVLREAFEAVPPALRNDPPAPDRWSVAAIIDHLAVVEHRLSTLFMAKVTAARAEGIAAETSTEPILPTFNIAMVLDRSTRVEAPSAILPTGLDADAAWAELERGGASVRTALLAGDGLALGTITYPHPLFGPLTLYNWFAFVAAHEARHAAQIREIAADTVAS